MDMVVAEVGMTVPEVGMAVPEVGMLHWDRLVYWSVAFVDHQKKNRLRPHLKKTLLCMQF